MLKQLNYKAACELRPGGLLRDNLVKGLLLRARKTERTFYFYYRYAGEQRYMRLGVFPTLGIDAAREAARAHVQTLARGEDPQRPRREATASPRICELWDEYRRVHVDVKCKPGTRKIYDSYYNAHISKLGDVRVADLNLERVNAFLTRIGQNTPANANRVRALLWQLMDYAEVPEVNYRPHGSNPVKRSVTFKEYRRKRHIKTDEFPAIGAAMRAEAKDHPREVAAILCVLLTGSRVTELATARHSDLDVGRACIVLREHKTDRTGDERVIWLPAQAFALIRNLPADRTGYLFGKDANRFSLRRIWLRITHAAGCPDVRLQDLRRTFASVAKTGGAGLHAVGELLGHKQAETTQRYAYLFEERAAGLANETGDKIAGLLEGTKG